MFSFKYSLKKGVLKFKNFRKMTECICPICLDSIDPSDTSESPKSAYRLPECGCLFHSECIIAWFRQGRKSCPTCRAVPTNDNDNSSTPRRGRFWSSPDIKDARKFAKKNPDHEINNLLKRLKKKEETRKQLLKDKKELQNSSGIYREIKRKITSIQRRIWLRNMEIIKLKNNINFLYPVVNLVIVTRVENVCEKR